MNFMKSYLCDTFSSPARQRQYSSVVVVAWAAQLLQSWFLRIMMHFSVPVTWIDYIYLIFVLQVPSL